MTDTFDLKTLQDAQSGEGWVTITHPQTGAPTPMRIRVASPDSDTFRKADRKIKNRNLANVQKRGSQAKMTSEKFEADAIELLKAITLGWEGVTWAGSPMEFTPDNVETLYTEFPFIREQVDEFVGDRANFLSK